MVFCCLRISPSKRRSDKTHGKGTGSCTVRVSTRKRSTSWYRSSINGWERGRKRHFYSLSTIGSLVRLFSLCSVTTLSLFVSVPPLTYFLSLSLSNLLRSCRQCSYDIVQILHFFFVLVFPLFLSLFLSFLSVRSFFVFFLVLLCYCVVSLWLCLIVWYIGWVEKRKQELQEQTAHSVIVADAEKENEKNTDEERGLSIDEAVAAALDSDATVSSFSSRQQKKKKSKRRKKKRRGKDPLQSFLKRTPHPLLRKRQDGDEVKSVPPLHRVPSEQIEEAIRTAPIVAVIVPDHFDGSLIGEGRFGLFTCFRIILS